MDKTKKKQRAVKWIKKHKRVSYVSAIAIIVLVTLSVILINMPYVHALTWASVGGNAPLYYIPVTLTNNARLDTTSGFQQQITINSNTNNGYYASNLDNINWQDGSSNILSSWLESGLTSTSTASVYWVNLGSLTIAANGGTLTIYEVIYGTSVNCMNTANTGAQPQYTGTYGQYDDGAAVFATLYQNFTGTGTPSGWTKTGTVTINKGASVSTIDSGLYTAATYGLSSSQILDINGTFNTGSGNPYHITNNGIGYVTTDSCDPQVSWGTTGSGTTQADITYTSSGTSNIGTETATLGTAYIFTMFWNASTYVAFQENYGSKESYTSKIPSSAENVGASLDHFSPTAGTAYVAMQWARIRVAPPINTMPSASAGSLTSITAATHSFTATDVGKGVDSSACYKYGVYQITDAGKSIVTFFGLRYGIYMTTDIGKAVDSSLNPKRMIYYYITDIGKALESTAKNFIGRFITTDIGRAFDIFLNQRYGIYIIMSVGTAVEYGMRIKIWQFIVTDVAKSADYAAQQLTRTFSAIDIGKAIANLINYRYGIYIVSDAGKAALSFINQRYGYYIILDAGRSAVNFINQRYGYYLILDAGKATASLFSQRYGHYIIVDIGKGTEIASFIIVTLYKSFVFVAAEVGKAIESVAAFGYKLLTPSALGTVGAGVLFGLLILAACICAFIALKKTGSKMPF